ncbi:hypothetical protein KCU77_g3596, partial [Aureobasidium melanogenum]
MQTSQILLCLGLIIVSCAAMTDNHVKDWFNNQVELQKQSAMRFTGRHNVLVTDSNATKETIDFDFHAEMSGFADLNRIQIERSNVAEKDLVTTARDGKTDDSDLVQQTIEKLEKLATLGYDRITIDHVFVNYDGMLANLQTWAERARYGGRVGFDNENISGALRSEPPTASDNAQIIIRAVWRYKWDKPEVKSSSRRVLQSPQNIRTGPKPMSWDRRIQHAMVDGEQGVVYLDDDVSAGVPMTKAVAKYALHETLTMQGNFGTSRIHKWGLDEPNDEPPYVGTRRFGGFVRELPPAYNE